MHLKRLFYLGFCKMNDCPQWRCRIERFLDFHFMCLHIGKRSRSWWILCIETELYMLKMSVQTLCLKFSKSFSESFGLLGYPMFFLYSTLFFFFLINFIPLTFPHNLCFLKLLAFWLLFRILVFLWVCSCGFYKWQIDRPSSTSRLPS